LVIADNLEKGGQESRVKAIRYLIERVKIAEEHRAFKRLVKLCNVLSDDYLEKIKE